MCSEMCKKEASMATNLALDDNMIKEAVLLGHHKSKKEAVTEALLEYIKRKKQLSILDSFGTVKFDDDYNYKDGRQR